MKVDAVVLRRESGDQPKNDEWPDGSHHFIPVPVQQIESENQGICWGFCYNLAAMASKLASQQDSVSRLRFTRAYPNLWHRRSLGLVLVALAYSQTPNVEDLIWQTSVSEYASARKIRLEQVRQHSPNDRFQPTWKSLEQYRT